MYNMDEKGFSLGTMTKQHRVFTKEAVQKKRVLGYAHDGNREWITILATICADGSWCPPAIIFAGKEGPLRASWVDDVELGRHNALFATSPNGWTNDKTRCCLARATYSTDGRKQRLVMAVIGAFYSSMAMVAM